MQLNYFDGVVTEPLVDSFVKYLIGFSLLDYTIDVNHNLKYPIERNQISNAFHYFVPWAESGGTFYSDWYMNETGYRNNSLIYEF